MSSVLQTKDELQMVNESSTPPAGSGNPQPEPARERISAFIITYNEESNIDDCLASVDFCDEIVVVDSFSSDQTVEKAKAAGAVIFQRPWPGYREQKAFGLKNSSHEWVFNLDADERVSPELRESILDLLRLDYIDNRSGVSAEDRVNGYYISRVVFYLGRWWRRGGWYPEFRLRLFRKNYTEWGGVDPHEKPIVSGPTATLPGEILHYTYRSIDEQFVRLNNHSSVAAREELARGTKAGLMSLLTKPLVRMIKFYIFKRGYREGMPGLVVAMIEGYYTFMKYAKIWGRRFQAEQEAAAKSASAAASSKGEIG